MNFACTAWTVTVILGLGAGYLLNAQDTSQASSPAPGVIARRPPPPPPMPPKPPTRTNLPVASVTRTKPAGPAPVTPPVPAPPPAPSTPAITQTTAPKPAPAPAPPPQLPGSVIAWDADTKEYTAKPGEMTAPFTFYFTNVSSEEVIYTGVHTSCGCTVAQLPTPPWKLPPGTNGAVPVLMSLANKHGIVFKTVTFNTDKGYKTLMLKVTIQPPPPPTSGMPPIAPMERSRNQELAKEDRQAVFKGDCASCHVEKAKGKLGQELYVAACGICHESPNRATMVPDLHVLTHDTNADFWRTWIARGKPGSLMPAFAQSEGGPLSDGEIDSIVQYLVTAIPSRATAPAGGSGAAN